MEVHTLDAFFEILKAILFGIVEGITEWLPISSTGHMILLDEFVHLKVSPEFYEMFQVVIQLGAILAVVLLFFKKTRKTGLMMGIALATGLLLINGCMKPLVGRIRPFDVQTAVTLLIEKPHDFSFPSGHTLACFEATTVLLARHKKLGIPALVVSVLIAFSRMYLYVHYLTDVLAGIVFGVLIGLFAMWLVNTVHRQIQKKRGI